MTDQGSELIVCCNHEKAPPAFRDLGRSEYVRLEYDSQPDGIEPNVRLSLRPFVRGVYHLPDRLRDLLEIAGFVFSADRSFSRGARDAVEFHSWARRFEFHIKVRDYDFWATKHVQRSLASALEFMSGDQSFRFHFYPGRPTEATSLFDSEDFGLQPDRPSRVVLFSGGLDSLTGAIDILENTQDDIYLVSHRSYQPSTAKTQDRLAEALKKKYPNRVAHYKFYCSFTGVRARDENQRTRSFLYSSIAFTLAQALSIESFFVFENGVTAINFPKREDMANARASRTTHPKTVSLLQGFFTLVADTQQNIQTPFLWLTKADIARKLSRHGMAHLLPSSVSCSRTFRNTKPHTHCGECSQCLDRRISAHAAGLQAMDHSGLYTFDLLSEPLSGEAKTIAIDYVRQAAFLANASIDMFYDRMINELVDICAAVDMPDEEVVEYVYRMHHSHGADTLKAIHRMIGEQYDLSRPLPEGAFLRLVVDYEHLKIPAARFVEKAADILISSIPLIFQRNQPIDEVDLNDKIQGILDGHIEQLEREHPAVSFALAKAVPDHSAPDNNVLIETKYLREGTPPSKATEGIAADLTKYPNDCFILFVVYDPHRAIKSDSDFRKSFEEKRPDGCRVLIIR